MKLKSTAILRRARRLTRLMTLGKKSQSLGNTMVDLMVHSALSPLAAAGTKPRKPSKAKKSVPKASRTLRAVLPARALPPLATGPATKKKASPRIPDGAQYLTRHHRSAAGSRSYKLYVPATLSKQPKGLIVMLHGCKQTPDDFALGTHMNALAQKHGLAVAYPAQTVGQNAGACWNWFQRKHQTRGAGEPAILAAMTRKLMKEFDLARDDVFVAGLSAGGAMAAILADVYPDVFSAAGVHSGLARGSASNAVSAMMAMHSGGASDCTADVASAQPMPVRWIVFQGADDRTVHPSNAALIVCAVVGTDATPDRTFNRAAKGRGYVRTEYDGPNGATLVEHWMVENTGHAWSGGRASGTYTDTSGPDASAQMIRFFTTKTARPDTGAERAPKSRVPSM